ncbi:hypothetical protein DFS34DRAFT_675572, partial [Phlyctochytrium arcticum]
STQRNPTFTIGRHSHCGINKLSNLTSAELRRASDRMPPKRKRQVSDGLSCLRAARLRPQVGPGAADPYACNACRTRWYKAGIIRQPAVRPIIPAQPNEVAAIQEASISTDNVVDAAVNAQVSDDNVVDAVANGSVILMTDFELPEPEGDDVDISETSGPSPATLADFHQEMRNFIAHPFVEMDEFVAQYPRLYELKSLMVGHDESRYSVLYNDRMKRHLIFAICYEGHDECVTCWYNEPILQGLLHPAPAPPVTNPVLSSGSATTNKENTTVNLPPASAEEIPVVVLATIRESLLPLPLRRQPFVNLGNHIDVEGFQSVPMPVADITNGPSPSKTKKVTVRDFLKSDSLKQDLTACGCVIFNCQCTAMYQWIATKSLKHFSNNIDKELVGDDEGN